MKVEYKDKVPVTIELNDSDLRQAILEFAQRNLPTLNIPNYPQLSSANLHQKQRLGRKSTSLNYHQKPLTFH